MNSKTDDGYDATGDARTGRPPLPKDVEEQRIKSESRSDSDDNFTPEERTKLLQSVIIVGMAVTAADPSGLWGLLKESIASGRTMMAAQVSADSNELIKKVIADFQTSQGRAAAREGLHAKLSGVNSSEMRDKAISALREVSNILDAKAGDNAKGFKVWLLNIAQEAAEAAKEGGFFGIGGVQVSEAERATLAEIAHVLQIEPPRG
jgi:hypothetical protein